MEKSSSDESAIHRSPSLDSHESDFARASASGCPFGGRGFTAGAFYGSTRKHNNNSPSSAAGAQQGPAAGRRGHRGRRPSRRRQERQEERSAQGQQIRGVLPGPILCVSSRVQEVQHGTWLPLLPEVSDVPLQPHLLGKCSVRRCCVAAAAAAAAAAVAASISALYL
ncbi:hypothetical protein NHX12_002216 [Muraenolepis orangiensis]|uniref:Uncharacterized protein n=1 Tax=Muraenolepis orangiensis TaxID=630683 RepID=A0A9Q0E0F3_9TELE|nr:hypothetical protein NHX12_002216 [Muraenolepis orangiensis]